VARDGLSVVSTDRVAGRDPLKHTDFITSLEVKRDLCHFFAGTAPVPGRETKLIAAGPDSRGVRVAQWVMPDPTIIDDFHDCANRKTTDK
jgi:hypothetical protein